MRLLSDKVMRVDQRITREDFTACIKFIPNKTMFYELIVIPKKASKLSISFGT